MLWIVVFIIIGIISFFLTLRSMKDYEERPADHRDYGLYHLAKAAKVEKRLLEKLHQISLQKKFYFSLEKLVKEDQEALILYLPRETVGFLEDVDLIEIEDYLKESGRQSGEEWILNKQIDVNNSFTFTVLPDVQQDQSGPELRGFNGNGLTGFQSVLTGVQQEGEVVFQSTMRVIVEEKDSLTRVGLVKKLKTEILKNAGLDSKDEISNLKNFADYKRRVLIPVQVEKRIVTADTLARIFN